jgi:hypothetical protein
MRISSLSLFNGVVKLGGKKRKRKKRGKKKRKRNSVKCGKGCLGMFKA